MVISRPKKGVKQNRCVDQVDTKSMGRHRVLYKAGRLEFMAGGQDMLYRGSISIYAVTIFAFRRREKRLMAGQSAG